MSALNTAQLEILKLFDRQMSEAELMELKQLLIDFLAKKVVEEADKAFDEKGYTAEDIERWKTEHFQIEKDNL
ncbi:MAG: hypothetical protein ACK4TA_21475 [Saprospiraceae bacterium]